jgi:putative oxidoreductase
MTRASLPFTACRVTVWELAQIFPPVFIKLGMFVRLTAPGMIGFIIIPVLTDIYGHWGISDLATFGTWFDKVPDGVIQDHWALVIHLNYLGP